jgi:hypothetical protein
VLLPSSPACAARRAIKKKIETPTPWFASTDMTYSNWLKDTWEGGGESRVGGLQLGLSMPYGFSAFVRVSAMPEPNGLLDTRAGLSKSFVMTPSLRNTLSSSFSIPSSEYSRSLQQKTQASLASTQEIYWGAATFSFTAYGAKAYYANDGAIPAEAASLMLLRKDKVKKNGRRPVPTTPRITGKFTGDELATGETIEIDYGSPLYMTRFDYLGGGVLDLAYRFTSEWAVNSAGSLTRSTFSTEESIWTSDVTLLQIGYARKSISIFAAAGLLDSSPIIQWPRARTYTVGTSYSLIN